MSCVGRGGGWGVGRVDFRGGRDGASEGSDITMCDCCLVGVGGLEDVVHDMRVSSSQEGVCKCFQ